MFVLKDVLRPRLKLGSSGGGKEFQPDKYLTDRIKCISKSFVFQLGWVFSQAILLQDTHFLLILLLDPGIDIELVI